MKNLTRKILSTIAATALGLASLPTAEAADVAVANSGVGVDYALNIGGGWASGSLPFDGINPIAGPNTIIAVWENFTASSGKSVGQNISLYGLKFGTMTTAGLTHSINRVGGTYDGTNPGLTIGGGGITIATDSSNVSFNGFSAPNNIMLAASQTWSVGTGRTMIFSNDTVVNAANASVVLTLTGGGTIHNNGGAFPFGSATVGTTGQLIFDGIKFKMTYSGTSSRTISNPIIDFKGENSLEFEWTHTTAAGVPLVLGATNITTINFPAGQKNTIHLAPLQAPNTTSNNSYIQIGNGPAISGDNVTFDNPSFVDPLNLTPKRTQVVISYAWATSAFRVKNTTVSAGVDFYFGETSTNATYPVQMTVLQDGQLSLGAYTGAGTGKLSFSQTFASLSGGGVITTSLNANATPVATDIATLTINSTNLAGAATTTTEFSGVLKDGINGVNSLSLVKNGASTQILSGTNTYTGTTTVSGGALIINGSLATGSAVTVANGATLGGTGTIGGTVSVSSGGILMDGLTFSNGLTLANTTTIKSDGLNTTTIATGKTLSLGTGLTLNLLGTADDWEIGAGYTTNIFDVTGATVGGAGTWLSSLTLTGPAGLNLSGVTFDNAGGYLSIVGLRAIPEPSTYLLLGASLLAVVIFRRRK